MRRRAAAGRWSREPRPPGAPANDGRMRGISADHRACIREWSGTRSQRHRQPQSLPADDRRSAASVHVRRGQGARSSEEPGNILLKNREEPLLIGIGEFSLQDFLRHPYDHRRERSLDVVENPDALVLQLTPSLPEDGVRLALGLLKNLLTDGLRGMLPPLEHCPDLLIHFLELFQTELFELACLFLNALGVLHGLGDAVPTGIEKIEERSIDEIAEDRDEDREVHDLRDQEFPINAEFREEFHGE